MSDSSDFDDREWDSAHCCSCCCDCCACHKISHAFWWVLFFTFALFATGVGVFLDGISKQSKCSNSLNQDDPASVHSYDDCRQQAYVQLLASIALGGAFIILVFVSCCAFMDILCFKRWRSRPHMRPNTTPRAARKQPTPRGTPVQYDTVAGGNDAMERQGQRSHHHHPHHQQHYQYPQQSQPQQQHPQQQQQLVAMRPMYSLRPAPKSVVMPQPSPPPPSSVPQLLQAPPASMQLQPSLQVTPPLSSPLPAAPTNRGAAGAAPTTLSPMPTLGEQMRAAAAAAAAASVAPSAPVSTVNPPSADVSQLGGSLAPSPIPTRPAAPSMETR